MKDTVDHTASYYAATANRRSDYPRLAGEHRFDVAVVGAGYTGLSAALFLAERGYKVAVVEARRVGWGASGRNGGQLIDGFVETDKIEKRLGARAAEIAWQMGIECRDIVIERIREYSIDCDLKLGYLDLALKPSDMKNFRSAIEDKRRLGYPHEMRIVERDELPSFVGSPIFIGGMVNAANGHLHPLNLCLGEARAIEQRGGRIFEHSQVLRVEHGHKPKVHTADGVIHADKVVLAGNAYLGRTEPRIFGQVIPAGSYMIATEKLPENLARELLPQDHAACNQKVVLDYFRLSADKRMLFGGFCNYSGRDPRDITASLRPKLLHVFPQLEAARIEFEWGGNIGISINRIPQLGRIEGNTYYAQGYSGHGLAPTHMAGKVIADAIGGDLERFDVFERIHHWRLPGGKWFANPALAAGMLY
ncbi:MAG TPA: FAD-binding oxidoreductase, partial [Woeseiaceae bacterium]|nr:FAD-binding oxidoreductase [Woeseiaceae bacterium]